MESNCKRCGAAFVRYNTIQNLCRDCSHQRQVELQGKARVGTSLKPLPMKQRKPIKQRGKVAKQDLLFRDKVLRPFLDKKYGLACSNCGVMPPMKEDGTYYRHDADHVKGKGPHPELRFDVNNFVYLCRDCHIKKTGVPQWSR